MPAFLDRRTLGLLAETTAAQALGTMAVLTVPAIAPEVAAALGVAPGLVGGQIGLVYLAATLSSLGAGSAVAAFGPWRTSQVAMLLAAGGTLLASVPQFLTLALGSVSIGLAYGLLNPASSDLLARHAPPARRNLVFAIKQTGVPLGGVGAGLRESDPELREQLDAAITSMKEDGSLDALLAEWFPNDDPALVPSYAAE